MIVILKNLAFKRPQFQFVALWMNTSSQILHKYTNALYQNWLNEQINVSNTAGELKS